MSVRHWTLDYLARLTDYQLLMALRPEEDGGEQFPDGGGDCDFLLFWQAGKAAGKSNEEIIARWCQTHTGRLDEAIIDPRWEVNANG